MFILEYTYRSVRVINTAMVMPTFLIMERGVCLCYSLQYSTSDYNDPCKNNTLRESNDTLALLTTKITPVVILQRLR